MRLVLSVVLPVVAAFCASTSWADVIQNGVLVDTPSPVFTHQSGAPQLPALSVSIDFDDLSAPCLFLQTDPLRNEYTGLGVVFSGPSPLNGGAIVDTCGNWAVSGFSAPNFVGFNFEGTMQNGGIPVGPERMDFSQDVSAIQVGVATPEAGLVANLNAFSAANVLLASNSINVTSAMQTLSVNAPGIRYAILDVPRAGAWIFDNLSFETMPTAAQGATWARVKSAYH